MNSSIGESSIAYQGLPGRVSRLPRQPVVSETIYIADKGAQRIVKLDNLSGAGWATLTANTLGLGTLPVSSVAVDKQGKIYFCAAGKVHRVNNIAGQGHVSMNLPSNAGVDNQVYVRSNGWVYVTVGTNQVIAYDTVGASAVQKWQVTHSGSPTPPSDLFVDSAGTVTLATETVISGGNSSQYPGIILEIQSNSTVPVSFFPVQDLRGVTRDSGGRIYFATKNGIVRMNNISGAGQSLMSTTNPVVGCALASSKIITLMPSGGKVGALSLTPNNSQSWFGSLGTGVNQYSSPVDVCVYAFNTNAL